LPPEQDIYIHTSRAGSNDQSAELRRRPEDEHRHPPESSSGQEGDPDVHRHEPPVDKIQNNPFHAWQPTEMHENWRGDNNGRYGMGIRVSVPGEDVFERDGAGEAGEHERRREHGVDDAVDVGAGGRREHVAAAGRREVGARHAYEQQLCHRHRRNHQQRHEPAAAAGHHRRRRWIDMDARESSVKRASKHAPRVRDDDTST